VTLSSQFGTISDQAPAMTQPYPNDARCQWDIAPKGDAPQIILTVTAIETELGFDRLAVYSSKPPPGTDGRAQLLAVFSGTEGGSVTSTSGRMYLDWETDRETQFLGFVANYAVAGAPKPDAKTPSPGTPPPTMAPTKYSRCARNTQLRQAEGEITDGFEAYQANEKCDWLILPPVPGTIFLTVSKLELEVGFDYVKVYDGASMSAPLVATLTDFGPVPQTILAVNKAMYVEFSADDSVNAGGFEARFSTRETAAPTLAPTVPATPVPVIQEIGGACGKTFFEGSDNGIITDGSGILRYENNLACGFTLSAASAIGTTYDAYGNSLTPSKNSYYRLDFTQFSLETNYDYIYVYSGHLEMETRVNLLQDDSIVEPLTSTFGPTRGETVYFLASQLIGTYTGTYDARVAAAVADCMSQYSAERCQLQTTDNLAYQQCLDDNVRLESQRRTACMRSTGALPPMLEINSPAVHIAFVSDLTIPDTGFEFKWSYHVNQSFSPSTDVFPFRRSEAADSEQAASGSSSTTVALSVCAAVVAGILVVAVAVLMVVKHRRKQETQVQEAAADAAVREDLGEEISVDWM